MLIIRANPCFTLWSFSLIRKTELWRTNKPPALRVVRICVCIFCRHLPATGEWREGIPFAQRVNSNGIPSIDRKSSWFGLTYGIGMCYAERSICKNGNRRVICLFLCIKMCCKSLSFSYGECQKDCMEKRRGKKRWERKRQGKLT